MSSLRLQRPGVRRIACSVVAVETRRLREAELPQSLQGEWSEATSIGEEGLELDSLEQLGALGALAETFGIDDSILGEERPLTVGAWIDWIMRGLDVGVNSITVLTSGSTGSPRPCQHVVTDLLDEAAFLAAQFGDRRRVVALVPAHHLYGMIWTALLPDALGVPVVVRTIGMPLGLVPGDLIVAVPDQWRAMLRLTRRFPQDVIGISSAGTLDNLVGTGLIAAGLTRLIDVYGSSETGAIAMRDVPAPAYELLPRWHLTTLGDGDWQLVDRTGAFVALPDYVERTSDRFLLPAGRRDGAVQVAGLNVWPQRIAGVLREVSGVADASVRLHTDGRLKAFIVPRDFRDTADLLAVLERTVSTQLLNHERPKSFTFGASLPCNAMGKLEDWSDGPNSREVGAQERLDLQ